MKEFYNYLAQSMSGLSDGLSKKAIFLDKPWALIDNDLEIQKFIFKRNGELILSKNGIVKTGAWEYFSEAKSLLIDQIDEKWLLNQVFVDDHVMLLKKDGTSNDFFSFANVNLLPDYDVKSYLLKQHRIRFDIRSVKLFDGNKLYIHSGNYGGILNKKVELLNSDFTLINAPDGSYLSEGRNEIFIIKNGEVQDGKYLLTDESIEGEPFEIEGGYYSGVEDNVNKKITSNGQLVSSKARLINKQNVIYNIDPSSSKILTIEFLKTYDLKNGFKIKVRQKKESKISKNDVIEYSKPMNPIPNGKYKIKGKFKSITVENSTISSVNFSF